MLNTAEAAQATTADAKRFLELYLADPVFRQRTAERPDPLAQRLRPLWTGEGEGALETGPDPLVQAYRIQLDARRDERRTARTAAVPSHRRFRLWRERQMARCRAQLGPANAEALIHHPAAFELSRGCSVGCWFCAVSAPKLKDLFDYPTGAPLWRGVLQALADQIGPAAGQSVCYWATDPFDQPHYEQCCLDLFRLTGTFPPTTTALADRRPDRTRALLDLARQHGGRVRFSVLSLGQLRRLHRQFSAQELADVELVLQNRGSLQTKVAAGRALGHPDGADGATIACVSGFLVNMVTRTVALISPSPADSEHPDGYRTHGLRSFESAQQFREALEELTSPEAMPECLPLAQKVAPRPGLARARRALIDRHATYELEDHGWPELLDRLWEGRWSPAELAQAGLDHQPMEATLYQLNRLYRLGALDDPPGHESPTHRA